MVDGVLKTETILDRLVAGKREQLAASRAIEPLTALQNRAMATSRPVPFDEALRGTRVRLIAEIKRSSPAAGLLDPTFDPSSRARAYAMGGAAAISVLTEERQFGGRLEDIAAVRAALTSDGSAARLPVLRKDFLFDPYQLYEARAAGADAVLLIVAVLEQSALTDLLALAANLGLGVLVEVHDEAEVDRALIAGAGVVGINNRDLHTFETSLEVTVRLLPYIAGGPVVVSESGIHCRDDVERMASLGVDAVLVGEALMRSDDIGGQTRAFSQAVKAETRRRASAEDG